MFSVEAGFDGVCECVVESTSDLLLCPVTTTLKKTPCTKFFLSAGVSLLSICLLLGPVHNGSLSNL